jgi:glycine oxidase
MVDYLIVGSGLAGIAVAEQALQHNRSVLVIDDGKHNSSRVAAGLYNPVILKRLSGISQAQQQLDVMNRFYDLVEEKLRARFRYPLPTLRKFFSVEEQNNWFLASDKPALTPFLSTKLVKEEFKGIDSPFGFGEVLQTGFVETGQLLSHYHQYLESSGLLLRETFDHEKLEQRNAYVEYGDLRAKHIVFAEGFGIHANPFFNYLPLAGTKGELLVVHAPDLELDVVVNTNLFILPVGNHLYKVGATYNWTDKTDIPTPEGKAELIERLKKLSIVILK